MNCFSASTCDSRPDLHGSSSSRPGRLLSSAPWLLLIALGCSAEGPDNFQGPNGGASGAGAGAGGAAAGGAAGEELVCPDPVLAAGVTPTDGPTPGCAGSDGPAMANLGDFCIDSTEITNAHYARFLASSRREQAPPECSFNRDLRPEGGHSSCRGRYDLEDRANHPVGCVDWCDAYSYCAWAGKRLCGNIGGGSVPYDDYADPATSEWTHACSDGGSVAYPYGDAFSLIACNTTECGSGALPIGSASACHGAAAPLDGVFDMIGNVWEWTDACDGTTGEEDECWHRGGSYSRDARNPDGDYVPGSYMGCGIGSHTQRSASLFASIGFRCCSDAL